MTVIWANTAIVNFDKNIEYLKREWGNNVTVRFIDKTDECIAKIMANPEIGSYDNRLFCRKLMIVKQIYLIYEVKDNTLYVLNIWNNKRKTYLGIISAYPAWLS